MPVPNQEKTPRRSVRVPDELWLAVKEKARLEGETVTQVTIRKYEEYLDE